MTFGYGLKPRNVTERRLFAKQNKIQMFSKINSSVDGSGFVHYFIPKIRKQSFLSSTVSGSSSRLVGLFAHVATGTSQSLHLVLSVRNPCSLLTGLRSDSLLPLLYLYGLNTI